MFSVEPEVRVSFFGSAAPVSCSCFGRIGIDFFDSESSNTSSIHGFSILLEGSVGDTLDFLSHV